MVPRKIHDRTSGFLALLMMLLLLFAWKPTAHRKQSLGPPCESVSHVEARGDVRSPGVYPFCHQPDLAELLAKAGGLKKGKGSVEVPKRPPFASGSRVVIRREGKAYRVSREEMSAFYKVTLGIPLSLNKESEEGLTAIPGIGPALAKRIVQERSKQGRFKTLNEIGRFRGIGQKLYRKIKPYLIL